MTRAHVVLGRNINTVMVRGNPLVSELYIGVMSGTSLDGVDAVLYDFANHRLISSYFVEYSAQLRARIISLTDTTSYSDITHIEHELNELYLAAIQQLIAQVEVSSDTIIAIGIHGQTIYHNPKFVSVQLGSGAYIAYHTGITTINDFRTRDIIAGGEGAPLTPKYHQYLLKCADITEASIVNIGGIANITVVDDNGIIGFDSGPGNTLLNAYVEEHYKKPFDDDGEIARSGKVIPKLLTQMLSDAYFKMSAPKSTGTEYFNLEWLKRFDLNQHTPADIVCTLTELTAHTISEHITTKKVYLCGGGAHNRYMHERITTLLPSCEICTTEILGAPVDYLEAIAFAYFAKLHRGNLPANIPSVTGATAEVVLGTLHTP